MPRLVVDSSVVIKWFVVEPLTAQARLILDDYLTARLRLLAPDLIFAELGNIVWKKCLYQGLAMDDAQIIIETLTHVNFEVTASSVLLPEAYQLAIATRCTVYDALYLALSIRENCRFISADKRLVNAVQHTFANILWIGDLT